jgi:hypothetical protein
MAETDTRAMPGLQWGAWLLLVLQMLLGYWILWLGESHVPSGFKYVPFSLFNGH